MPKIILGLLAVTVLAGCGDRAAQSPNAGTPTPANNTSAPATSAEEVPEAATITAPQTPQPSPAVTLTTDSWEGLLNTLPEQDKEELQAINRRNFGALAFRDESERKRLQDLGFPTAEDILEASKLTDGELKALADGGDEQAQMLLVDRLLAQAEQARASGDQSSFKAIAARAMFEASMLIPRTQSPFGAYLDGRANWQLVPGQPPEVMAASLMVAADLGDWRAKTWLKKFERDNPGLDAAATLTAYNVLRRTWRVPQKGGTAK